MSSVKKYSVVLLGGSRVGKNSFITAAQTVAREHSQSGDVAETPKRWTLRRLSQNLGQRKARLSLKISTELKISNNNNSGTDWAISPPPSEFSDEVSPEMKQKINYVDKDIKYELSVKTHYNPGVPFSVQEQIVHADIIIIVIDLTNKFSMDRAKLFHRKVLDARHTYYGGVSNMFLDTYTAPILLVATKYDVTDRRQISTIEGLRLADEWKCTYIEVSNTTLRGVDNTLREIINAITTAKKQSVATTSSIGLGSYILPIPNQISSTTLDVSEQAFVQL